MNEDRRIPDLYAERDALGELPLDLEPGLRDRLDSEPGCSMRRERIKVSNQEILEQHPVDEMAARIRMRLEKAPDPHRGARLRVAMAAVPAAALLLVAVFVFVPGEDSGRDLHGTGETILLKGDPRLVIHRRVAEGSKPLNSGDRAQAGDRLQLSYLPSEATHGVIVSIDGRGQVTLHFPADLSRPTNLARQDLVSLPFSYELDDAPGFERFIFVTSGLPIPVTKVLQAARNLGADPQGALELAPEWTQKSFLLNKP